MAKNKSLFELIPGQSVSYPSRGVKVQRLYAGRRSTVEDTVSFRAVKNFPEGVFAVTADFPAEWELSTGAETMLRILERGLESRVRAHRFEENMRQVRPGIRYKVKKHLRRRHGSPAPGGNP